MSRLAQITLTWADDDYTFRLPIKQLMELQELCDAGPSYTMARLQQGTWTVQDVRETIRLGLIGGGMEADKALRLVRNYVDDEPLLPNAMTAEAIIAAAIVGVEEEDGGPPGKPKATPEVSPDLSVAKSDGPTSSDPDLPQD